MGQPHNAQSLLSSRGPNVPDSVTRLVNRVGRIPQSEVVSEVGELDSLGSSEALEGTDDGTSLVGGGTDDSELRRIDGISSDS